MIRFLLSVAFVLATAASASAHFVFVVPEPGGADARVILSEGLEPDEDVDVSLIGGAPLFTRAADGRDAPLKLVEGKDAYRVGLPGSGRRVVHGRLTFGVRQRGEGKPFLIVYHPKAVVGGDDAFDAKALLGDAAAAEIVPVGRPGETLFQVFAKGKPAPGVEITVILPDGKEEKVTTGADGRTAAFHQQGRYGAWARVVEAVAGEHGGSRYEEVRHYPTIVIDVGPAPRPATDAGREEVAPLPEAAASFGAAVSDGWLYVYGGHTARTHSYSTEAVSGRFHRLRLAGGKAWEELPGGPGLQGMNLVAHGGKVYRVGGMRPLNKPGERADNHSVAECAVFDPATKAWESLPPLPEPRSSHDLVVVGDTLIVVGGWNMRGREGNDWHGTALMLDLSGGDPRWKRVEQPFKRRALIAAAYGGKVYVIGGIDAESDTQRRVNVFDPRTGRWSAGPELPGGKRLNGFAPAACVAGGALLASVADGTLYRLGGDGSAWERVGSLTPRVAHRAVTDGSRVLVLGGAAGGNNLSLIEAVNIPASDDQTESGDTGRAAASVEPAGGSQRRE